MVFQVIDSFGLPFSPARASFSDAMDDKRRLRLSGFVGLSVRVFRSACNN